MLRGINQQTIFEDDEDFKKMLRVLSDVKAISKYKLFAYCLMQNHFHLLMKVEDEDLGQIFKRIGARYVYWYNLKYRRVGHLFQDRFKSEPIRDDKRFLTTLRYIHQNPIKAGICKNIGDYKWSSYKEYIKYRIIVDTEFVFGLLSLSDFEEFHKIETSEKYLDCEESIFRISDIEAKRIIIKISGCDNISEFQQLKSEDNRKYIRQLKDAGISIRQINRLTGISKGIVERV